MTGEYYVAWDWGVPQRGYYNTRPFDDFDHAADAARRLNEEWPGSRAHVCEARYGYLVEIQGP